jgi:hypothetical protein
MMITLGCLGLLLERLTTFDDALEQDAENPKEKAKMTFKMATATSRP